MGTPHGGSEIADLFRQQSALPRLLRPRGRRIERGGGALSSTEGSARSIMRSARSRETARSILLRRISCCRAPTTGRCRWPRPESRAWPITGSSPALTFSCRETPRSWRFARRSCAKAAFSYKRAAGIARGALNPVVQTHLDQIILKCRKTKNRRIRGPQGAPRYVGSLQAPTRVNSVPRVLSTKKCLDRHGEPLAFVKADVTLRNTSLFTQYSLGNNNSTS